MLLWNLPSPIVGPSPKDFASSLKFSPLYLGSQKPEQCYGWGKEKGRGRGGEGRKKKIKKERRKGMEIINLSAAGRAHLWRDPTPNPSDRHIPEILLVFTYD